MFIKFLYRKYYIYAYISIKFLLYKYVNNNKLIIK